MSPREREKAKVFVVEDDNDIRSSLLELLEDEGISADWASNGQEALEKLKSLEEKPDLILLDLRLPVIDGYQFRELQSADPSLSQIPVVVISADSKLKERGQISASEVLKKPLDIENLIKVVHRNLHAG